MSDTRHMDARRIPEDWQSDQSRRFCDLVNEGHPFAIVVASLDITNLTFDWADLDYRLKSYVLLRSGQQMPFEFFLCALGQEISLNSDRVHLREIAKWMRKWFSEEQFRGIFAWHSSFGAIDAAAVHALATTVLRERAVMFY